MSSTLREQLLKAGLVTEKQVRNAEEKRRPPPLPKRERGRPTPQDLAAQQAQAAKAQRDQAFNREKQAAAERKARLAQVVQLVEQNRLPRIEGDGDYQFAEGKYIRRVPANAAIRGQLVRGELAVVRHQGQLELIPAAIAARIRERDAKAILHQVSPDARTEPAPVEDAYKDFVVPDDLVW